MIKHFQLLIVKVLCFNVCLISRLRVEDESGQVPYVPTSLKNILVSTSVICQRKPRIAQVTVGSKRQRLEAGILGLFQISTHLDAFNTEHLLNASSSLGQRES